MKQPSIRRGYTADVAEKTDYTQRALNTLDTLETDTFALSQPTAQRPHASHPGPDVFSIGFTMPCRYIRHWVMRPYALAMAMTHMCDIPVTRLGYRHSVISKRKADMALCSLLLST